MNTSEYVATATAGLTGGGFVAGAVVLRKGLWEFAWAVREAVARGYTVTATFTVKPPPAPKPAPAEVPAVAGSPNGHARAATPIRSAL